MSAEFNKVVLVTGGTRGIGFGAARVLLKAGWSVAVTGTSHQSIEQACRELDSLGRVHGVAFRVEDREAWAPALDEIEKTLGPITALMANAGVAIRNKAGQSIAIIDEEFDAAWQMTMDINVLGAALAFSHVARRIVARSSRGAFVAISSIAGRIGSKRASSQYTASKAALIGLVRQQAHELGARGIRVNAICPGMIRTDQTKGVQLTAGTGPEIALGRIGEPEEIGEVVNFLLSDKASYVNGAIVNVDGGWMPV
ncbi:MAG TPA: SDR family NAD(P)-dependent oxidoreductase [Steroidobacteraceae bacterium]|jgi:NAD(P)-dependent dehydrogenase (short-subunit alcohol dehydrogenase family)